MAIRIKKRHHSIKDPKTIKPRHRRTKAEMEAAGSKKKADPFFDGCRCFIVFDGSWDTQHCHQHKAFNGIDPTVGHVEGCRCNQCLDKERLAIRIEKGLVLVR